MLKITHILTGCLFLLVTGCQGQASKTSSSSSSSSKTSSQKIGGQFENSDYLFQQMPQNISPVDTSPGWKEPGVKMLITGTIYQRDSKTPAPGIILYYYQTNNEGKYQHKAGEVRSMPPNDKGQTHGNIRGWIKTDNSGRYSIYTIRPGVYPGSEEPAHIHVTIKEPIYNEYYIDEFLFDDDKFLNEARRKRLPNRGGNGIVKLVSKNGMMVGERDIILGLNIPDYPN